ncbi:MAG: hypothetical protein ACM3OH_00940 [Bacillota bacterium]
MVLLLCLLLGPAAALAQTTAGMTAGASVIPALTVAGTADLAFGNVAPTSSKVVPARTGGRFSVNGVASQSVTVSFALPSNLGNPAVVVGNWTGLWGTVPGVGTAVSFSPAGPPTTFTLSAGGRLFFWIGGTVTTTAAPTGNYTSPLTLTVVYN